MVDKPNSLKWRTLSVTALPPGMSVTFSYDAEEFTWDAVALLHQHYDDDEHPWYGPDYERIVLGVLNPQRGEVETVEADEDGHLTGHIVRIDNRPVTV